MFLLSPYREELLRTINITTVLQNPPPLDQKLNMHHPIAYPMPYPK